MEKEFKVFNVHLFTFNKEIIPPCRKIVMDEDFIIHIERRFVWHYFPFAGAFPFFP
jgi:hypothetical protein